MLFTKPYVCLGPNSSGRDFVIGDLLGRLETLKLLLETVDFDPLRDRLFSIGNLLGTDSDSLDCLELAEEPWFYSLLGIFEALFFHELDGEAWKSGMFTDTRPCLQDEERQSKALARISGILSGLPMAMEVLLADGTRVGLSHAGIPPEYHWERVRRLTRRPEVLTDCSGQTLESALLWSRLAGLTAYNHTAVERFSVFTSDELAREERYLNCASSIAGIDFVIASFTRMPARNPVQMNNRIFLPAGLDEPNVLVSMLQLGTWRSWAGLPPTKTTQAVVTEATLTVQTEERLRNHFAMLRKYQKALERL